MAYIYRYIDKKDHIIKYVGIVWSNKHNLLVRHRQHLINEPWCNESDYILEYIDENITTRTDAEYFESHYISLYGTDKYFNSAKAGWGISSFLPNRENDWKMFSEKDFLLPDKNNLSSDKDFKKEVRRVKLISTNINKKIIKTKDELSKIDALEWLLKHKNDINFKKKETVFKIPADIGKFLPCNITYKKGEDEKDFRIYSSGELKDGKNYMTFCSEVDVLLPAFDILREYIVSQRINLNNKISALNDKLEELIISTNS